MLKRSMLVAIFLTAGAGIFGLSAGNLMAQTEQAQAPAMTEYCVPEAEPAIWGVCHVDSRVNAFIRVYINGCYRGTIAPGGDLFAVVADGPYEITELYAETSCGRFFWSDFVRVPSTGYHWVLYL